MSRHDLTPSDLAGLEQSFDERSRMAEWEDDADIEPAPIMGWVIIGCLIWLVALTAFFWFRS